MNASFGGGVFVVGLDVLGEVFDTLGEGDDLVSWGACVLGFFFL